MVPGSASSSRTRILRSRIAHGSFSFTATNCMVRLCRKAADSGMMMILLVFLIMVTYLPFISLALPHWLGM